MSMEDSSDEPLIIEAVMEGYLKGIEKMIDNNTHREIQSEDEGKERVYLAEQVLVNPSYPDQYTKEDHRACPQRQCIKRTGCTKKENHSNRQKPSVIKEVEEWLKTKIIRPKVVQSHRETKNQRAFVGGSWSDSGEEDDEKIQDETCLVAQAPNEICLGVDLEPDEWIKDSGCSKHMTGNRKLFSTYKAYNGGNVIFGSNLRGNIIGKGQICDNKCRLTLFEHDSEITKDGKVIGYSQNSKAYIILNKHTRKVEESLNVTFDETPPPSKTSPLVDDDLDEEEAIKVTEKKNLENVTLRMKL
ncbi:hypothetical protein Tco_1503795 [Tanacetum coccineum]